MENFLLLILAIFSIAIGVLFYKLNSLRAIVSTLLVKSILTDILIQNMSNALVNKKIIDSKDLLPTPEQGFIITKQEP